MTTSPSRKPTITACDTVAPTPPQRLFAAPGVLWHEDYCCFGFGAVKSVCVGAWVFFLVVPGLFFWLVAPGIQARLGQDLTLAALAMYAIAALFFVGTMCMDPGVPRRPPPASPAPAAPGQDKQKSSADRPSAESSELDHPGEGYILSRDSNRYVQSFDHFCEFVGNDIGGRNIGCFVGFLVSLALLASLLLLACVAATAVMWFGWTPHGAPPATLHSNPNPNPNPNPDSSPNPDPDPGEPPATLHFATAPLPYAVGGVVLLLLVLLVG